MINGSGGEGFVILPFGDKVFLQSVKLHQFFNLGDDAVLFGKRWKGQRKWFKEFPGYSPDGCSLSLLTIFFLSVIR